MPLLEREVNVEFGGGEGGFVVIFVVIFVVWGPWAQPNGARLCPSLGAAQGGWVRFAWGNAVLLKSTHFTGILPLQQQNKPANTFLHCFY